MMLFNTAHYFIALLSFSTMFICIFNTYEEKSDYLQQIDQLKDDYTTKPKTMLKSIN